MSVWTNIEETFGQRGAAVSVALERSEYQWNDIIRGSVHVTGGSHDQSLSELHVQVIEHVNGGRSYSRWNTHCRLPLAANLALGATSRYEFPFALRLPEAGEPTHTATLVSYEWYVEAEAHFPHALAAHSARADFVLRPPQITAAVAALAAALLQVAPFRLLTQSQDRAQVRYYFLPPPNAVGALDAIDLIAKEVDGWVQGRLRVNLKEHSTMDYLKAMVHKDIIDYPLSFPTGLLTASLGTTAPPEVITKLEELLHPFLG